MQADAKKGECHLVVARGVLAQRVALVAPLSEKFPAVKKMVDRLLPDCHSLLEMGEQKDDPDKMRFAADVVIAASSVLEALNKDLHKIPGVKFWFDKGDENLADLIMDADACVLRANRVLKKPLSRLKPEEMKLLTVSNKILQSERARSILDGMKLDGAARFKPITADTCFVFEGNPGFVGLSDYQGEYLYIQLAENDQDYRVKTDCFDPTIEKLTLEEYQQLLATDKACVRTMCRESTNNASRDENTPPRQLSASCTHVHKPEQLPAHALNPERAGETWAEAGVVFEARYFGLLVNPEDMCPFSLCLKRVPIKF